MAAADLYSYSFSQTGSSSSSSSITWEFFFRSLISIASIQLYMLALYNYMHISSVILLKTHLAEYSATYVYIRYMYLWTYVCTNMSARTCVLMYCYTTTIVCELTLNRVAQYNNNILQRHLLNSIITAHQKKLIDFGVIY